MNHEDTEARSAKKPVINLEELMQDGGGLPEVSVKSSCVGDWQRVLMDAHADLTQQLCYYNERGNERRVIRCLRKMEAICAAWRKKGSKE